MVIMRGEVGKDVKASGQQDPLQVLKARVSFPVLNGADGAPRCSGPGGELSLAEPRALAGLDDEGRRQRRHTPTRPNIEFVVFHEVSHVGADLCHDLKVPDPRHIPVHSHPLQAVLSLTGNRGHRRCSTPNLWAGALWTRP